MFCGRRSWDIIGGVMERMIKFMFWMLSFAFCALTLLLAGVFAWAVAALVKGGTHEFFIILRLRHDDIELMGLCWAGLLAGLIALYRWTLSAKKNEAASGDNL